MHKKFLSFFIDPLTREPLELIDAVYENDDIISGKLRSASNTYEIINGIPRFVPVDKKNYAKSFGYQWNKWKKVQFDSVNKGGKMEGYTQMMWEKICGVSSEQRFSGKVLLDIGAGPGRFIEVARAKGAMVIGLDYSEAVEAARENFRSDMDVCIVQGDGLNLPFPDAVLDGGYSIGVLHHTPNPSKGVAEARRVTKPNGWFGLSVYAKGGYYDKTIVQAWRKFFNLLWPVFKQYPALAYTYFVMILFWPIGRAIPFLGKLIRLLFPYVNLPDWKWSVLDTFDSLTPSYQSAHESYEVFRWFKDNQYKNIEPTDWSFTAYRGTV
jgi:ubiquinone/menaquinone biosynthesis C-methylase UbiE